MHIIVQLAVQVLNAATDPAIGLLNQGGDLYSALRNHPDTMRWERLGRKVALDVALGINYLHTRQALLDLMILCIASVCTYGGRMCLLP